MIELATATAASQTMAGNLEGMYSWGLSIIHLFQSAANPVVTFIARFFTLLGEPSAYILILPIIFWCIDEKRGFKIGMTVFISAGVNVAIKQWLQVPRPFYRDPTVKMIEQGGFSTPSGHAQGSATFWPLLVGTQPKSEESKKSRTALRLLIAIGLPLCIGLSRVYLGVHYPTDVLLGWTLGTLFSVSVLFVPNTRMYKNACAAVATRAQATGRSLKTLKLAVAALIALVLNAISGSDSSMGGVIFGFAAGYILLKEAPVQFNAASGTFFQKGLRLIVGIVILGGLYIGLKKIFPGEGSEYYTLFRFLRYGIIGFWASWGAPKVFIKTRLAS